MHRTTTFAASVPAQARIEVDATGQIVSVFKTTEGTSVQPSILNVYQNGVKITVTPQITQELDSIRSKIDWRSGGVVYQRREDASLLDVDVGKSQPSLQQPLLGFDVIAEIVPGYVRWDGMVHVRDEPALLDQRDKLPQVGVYRIGTFSQLAFVNTAG